MSKPLHLASEEYKLVKAKNAAIKPAEMLGSYQRNKENRCSMDHQKINVIFFWGGWWTAILANVKVPIYQLPYFMTTKTPLERTWNRRGFLRRRRAACRPVFSRRCCCAKNTWSRTIGCWCWVAVESLAEGWQVRFLRHCTVVGPRVKQYSGISGIYTVYICI